MATARPQGRSHAFAAAEIGDRDFASQTAEDDADLLFG